MKGEGKSPDKSLSIVRGVERLSHTFPPCLECPAHDGFTPARHGLSLKTSFRFRFRIVDGNSVVAEKQTETFLYQPPCSMRKNSDTKTDKTKSSNQGKDVFGIGEYPIYQ